MKILVVGGNGFVGSNVVKVLCAAGHDVVSRSRSNRLDLLDYDATSNSLAEIEPAVIVNCAAVVGSLNYVTERAAEVVDQNLRMILNLYRAVQQVVPKSVIVNPVANCAYPGNLDSYREDLFWAGELHPSVLSYGGTRRMMIVIGDCYRMQYGVQSLNFIVPNMYGPYDSTDPNKAHALNALASKLIKSKLEGRSEFVVWGTGAPIREWLFAGDFARLLTIALTRLGGPEFNRPMNIAQNCGLSVRQIVDILVEETEYEGNILWDQTKQDGAPKKVMEDTLFRQAFPEFQFTELRDGIRETIQYYNSLYPY
jgi:GDP-L-fucose synthase